MVRLVGETSGSPAGAEVVRIAQLVAVASNEQTLRLDVDVELADMVQLNARIRSREPVWPAAGGAR